MYNRNLISSAAGILLLVLAGCTSTMGPSAPPVTGTADEMTVEFFSDPVLMEDVVPADAVQGASLIAVEVLPDQLRFTYDAMPTAGMPEAGNVVFGDLGGGYMRRVANISSVSPTEYVLTTTPAALTEVFQELDFAMDFHPGSIRDTAPISDVGGVSGSSAALLDVTPNLRIAEGFTCRTSTGTVEAHPFLTFDGTFNVRIKITRAYFIWPTLVNAHFEMGGEITGGVRLNASVAAGVTCTWDAPLDSLAAVWTTPIPTPVGPIVLNHKIGPTLSVSASWTGAHVSGEVLASATTRVVIGTDKANEDAPWTDLSSASLTGSFDIPESTDTTAWSAEVAVSGGLKYELRVYDAIGPDMSVAIPITGTYEMSDAGCATTNLTIGANASVGVELRVPVLDTTIASASFTRELVAPISLPGFPIETGSCGDPCAMVTACDACVSTAGCGFCPGTGCISTASAGSCGSPLVDSPSACIDCTAHTDCTSCANDGFCGWCPGSGCLNDAAGGRATCGASYALNPWECSAP